MKHVWTSIRPPFFIILAIFALLETSVQAQTNKSKSAATRTKEQTSFSSEGKISKPVKLPSEVLEQLAQYDEGQLTKCQQDEFTRRPSVAEHFAAAPINLDGDQRADLIVQAQTPCFMGAHNTTFWMFTDSGAKPNVNYKMTFDITADFLTILKTSSNGFRDIETSSHTAVELYTIRWKFDGKKYRQSECLLRDENDQVTKVECNF